MIDNLSIMEDWEPFLEYEEPPESHPFYDPDEEFDADR